MRTSALQRATIISGDRQSGVSTELYERVVDYSSVYPNNKIWIYNRAGSFYSNLAKDNAHSNISVSVYDSNSSIISDYDFVEAKEQAGEKVRAPTLIVVDDLTDSDIDNINALIHFGHVRKVELLIGINGK